MYLDQIKVLLNKNEKIKPFKYLDNQSLLFPFKINEK